MRFDPTQLASFVKDSADAAFLQLVEEINDDQDWSDIRHIAYALATFEWETAGTFAPIEEHGKGRGKPYGQAGPNGKTYYGRGYVQLTWQKNYLNAGRKLHVDLVNHPELALSVDIAYKIAAEGMREGWFTGKKLADYINGDVCDYQNARRIINGTDRASVIEGLAARWERALKVSEIKEEAAVPAAPLPDPGQPDTHSFSLDGVKSQFESAKGTVESVSSTLENVGGFVGKRSDTIKRFRIFVSQQGLGIAAAIQGFWTSNKVMIFIGIAVIVLFALVYFLSQWHLGAIREKK